MENYFNIIGLDPGNHLGISVMTINPKDLSIVSIYTQTITLERHVTDESLKLMFLKNVVRDLYYVWKPSAISMEVSFLNMKYPKAVINLSQYVGVIDMSWRELDPWIKIYKYPPMRIKSVVSGSGKSDKDDMSVAVSKHKELKKLVNVSIMSEHEVDATAIAYTGLTELRENSIMYLLAVQ